MPAEESLSADDITVFRGAVEGIYEDGGHPIELPFVSGIYVGFYPSSTAANNLGVCYVYVADPAHHFDSPAPLLLSDAPDSLSKLSKQLQAVLYDITGEQYEFSKTDDEQGGVYYAAVLQRHPSATARTEQES